MGTHKNFMSLDSCARCFHELIKTRKFYVGMKRNIPLIMLVHCEITRLNKWTRLYEPSRLYKQSVAIHKTHDDAGPYSIYKQDIKVFLTIFETGQSTLKRQLLFTGITVSFYGKTLKIIVIMLKIQVFWRNTNSRWRLKPSSCYYWQY